MKRFQSRVAPLRELRQRREDEALQVHASTLRRRRAAEERLQAALDGLLHHQRVVQEDLRSGCPASRLAHHDGYRTLLERHRDVCLLEVAEAASAVSASLAEVMRTRRDREVVDRFCAKERVEHAMEQQREDQKNLDEMALRRRSVNVSSQPRPSFL